MLQKWPRSDISPIEALLIVFAYEKRTGEKVTPEQIHDGQIGDKLTKEDFEMALKVFKLVGERSANNCPHEYVDLSLPRLVCPSPQ